MTNQKGNKYGKKAKREEVLKRSGRSPKKVIDTFVDEKEPDIPEETIPVAQKVPDGKQCECGQPVFGRTNQCWACSHRA